MDSEIEKQTFHQHKIPILIKNVDISEIVVSNKVSFGKIGLKYFAGDKEGWKVTPYFILFPKINAYRTGFDETRYTPFW